MAAASKPSKKAEDVEVRLAEIVRLRNLFEYSWREIGEELSMHPDAARHAYASWLSGDREAILLEDPVELVQHKLYAYREARRSLLRMAEASSADVCDECGKPCGHESKPQVTLGAVRGLLELDRQEVVTRQLTGLLPRDLYEIRPAVNGRKFMTIFFDVLERNLVPGTVISEDLVDTITDEFAHAAGLDGPNPPEA